MPNYSYSKTFVIGTDKDSPEQLEMPCHWGTLRETTISFPDGCHGVAHVHVDDGLHQIYPTNPEETYALDGFTLIITDRYKIMEGTSKLWLRGYNKGIYPHTVKVTLTIEVDYVPNPAEEAILGIFKLLRRLFGRGD